MTEPKPDVTPMTLALRRAARVVAGLAMLVCLSVLAGYATRRPALVTILPGLRGMSPITAVGILAVALATAAAGLDRRRVAAPAAWCAIALGCGILALYVVAGSDVLSPSLADRLFGYDPVAAGRMSVATATCLVALGVAGLPGRQPRIRDGAASAGMIVSAVAILGYAYGVRDLYVLPVFDTMALHTAIALFTLGAASMAARADSHLVLALASDASGATRRQLTFAWFPPIAGWVLLRGVDAQRVGPAAAMALLVVATVAPLVYLILRDGLVQAALNAEREGRVESLAAAMRVTERRLAERTAALEREGEDRVRAEVALSQSRRMEAVGQLTGGIAHDFNNLLMAVGGNLEIALRRIDEGHAAHRFVANAANATERGAKLTAQLLAFSRTQRLDIRPVELDLVLRHARDLIGASLGPTIDVDLRLDAAGAWAMTDPDQLELAVFNLAVNARDAMAGTGRLAIESGRSRMSVNGGAEADYVSIRVVDTGAGMSPEIVARAVEPFFTTKDRGKGTGLGLAQVYGFVQQCRGDLRIASLLGQGTTVTLILPGVEAPAESAGAPGPVLRAYEAAAVDERVRRLVLVIDDDDGVRGVIVDALRTVGFDVVEARNGVEGLAQLEEWEPDAAVIDFIMPDMNGAEVARGARRRRPDLPVVFVSGYFDTVALEGIAGAVILRKPFDVAGLRQSVSSVLG